MNKFDAESFDITQHWKVTFEYGSTCLVHGETREKAKENAKRIRPDSGKPVLATTVIFG